MSSLYEDELKRLLKEKKVKLVSLKKKGVNNKEVNNLEYDINILNADLQRYQKAMAFYRVKPTQPISSKNLSASQS